MLFWLIAGVALGYFFKPQLDKVFIRVFKMVKNAREKFKNHDHEQDE
jgi:hypothetical protein